VPLRTVYVCLSCEIQQRVYSRSVNLFRWFTLITFTHAFLLSLTLISAAEMLKVEVRVIEGKAKIIDGDTIVVEGNRVRLHGIDAPESKQLCNNLLGTSYNCGQVATFRLAELIGEGAVRCEVRTKDRYNRLVAVCFLNGLNLNEQLVFEGLALAYRKYSMDFVHSENIAKLNVSGLWDGEFVKPWEWRRGVRLSSENNPEASPNSCRIKGNISRNGKIYHTPQSPWYGRTKIDTSKGEKWFCSEMDAKAQGWRAAHD